MVKGRPLAPVIIIVEPEVMVSSGGMSTIDEIYREAPKRLSAQVFSDYVATRVKKAEQGDTGGVYGNAML